MERANRYARKILNDLLDRFEDSSLYRDNTSGRRPFFYIREKNLPEYFDDTTADYKIAINETLTMLQEKGFVELFWQRFEEGNLLDKVALNYQQAEEIYSYIGRKPRAKKDSQLLELLKKHLSAAGISSGERGMEIETAASGAYKTGEQQINWFHSFLIQMIDRLEKGDTLYPYLSPDNLEESEQLCRALKEVSQLNTEIPQRLFSVKVFGDSKIWSKLERRAARIIKDFNPEINMEEHKEILAETGIIQNPQHIFLSGNLELRTDNKIIRLEEFRPDLGISTEMINNLEIENIPADYVITIENLTPYYHYIKESRDNYLAIYLGGYHNFLRRSLLIKLWNFCRSNNIDLPFYHWGDIDLGGFRIFAHLRQKTGIPIFPWNMDIDTLKKHEEKAQNIAPSYSKKLQKLLNNPGYSLFAEVISYMLEKEIRLEQEALL